MSIEVIPSMDFWEGKATRLKRGDFEEMEEVIQRLSAEEKQTFFGMSTTSDTQI